MRIPGSVAIVTGGARGFGKAFTEELLKRGASVCFADVNVTEGLQTEQAFRETYGEDKTMFVKCDVTSETDFTALWKTALEKFKSVDLMVNNAGILNEFLPQKTIEINLLGTMRGTDLAIKHMRKDEGGKGGVIVNVASTGGLFPVFFMPAYAASKYGVVGYTRSWAGNPLCQTYGLSFACLCPSFSKTSMMDNPRLVTYRKNETQVQELIQGIGVNKVDDVTTAFIELVEKEDNNGLFPVFFMPAYAASKYGVVGYTRSWAGNPLCQTYGLSFACLCPSFSKTSMMDNPRLVTYRKNETQVQELIQGIGVNKVDDVTTAFIELVEKEDNNGAVVTIEQSQGTIYRYTKHPHKL